VVASYVSLLLLPLCCELCGAVAVLPFELCQYGLSCLSEFCFDVCSHSLCAVLAIKRFVLF
jgi:hypothetical protein